MDSIPNLTIQVLIQITFPIPILRFPATTKTPFFNWVQTSVRLCGSGSQKYFNKIGLILKLRDAKMDAKMDDHYYIILTKN